LWVNTVLIAIIGILKIIETDHSGQHNDQGDQYLEQTGQQQSLLGLLQVLGSQCPLDDGLVHTPEIQLVYDQSGKQHLERQHGVGSPYDIELLGSKLIYLGKAVQHISAAYGHQCQYWNEQASQQKPESIDGIRKCHRLQSPENGINRTYDTYDHHSNPESFRFADAQNFRYPEQALNAYRPGIQYNGQQSNHKGKDQDDGHQRSGKTVKTVLQKLWDCGEPHF